MKPNLHRASAASPTPVLGNDPAQDPDAARRLKLTVPEIRQYAILVHIVFIRGAAALPAQIPWLEEIRTDQFLSDLHSEVI